MCDQTGWWRRVSGALASGSWVTLPRLIWRRRLVNFSQRFTPSTSILSTLCLTTCVTGLLLTFIGGGTAQLGTLVHRPSLHVHVPSTTLGTLTATKQTISWAKCKLLDPELKNRVPKIVTAYMTYSWNIWLLNVTAWSKTLLILPWINFLIKKLTNIHNDITLHCPFRSYHLGGEAWVVEDNCQGLKASDPLGWHWCGRLCGTPVENHCWPREPLHWPSWLGRAEGFSGCNDHCDLALEGEITRELLERSNA